MTSGEGPSPAPRSRRGAGAPSRWAAGVLCAVTFLGARAPADAQVPDTLQAPDTLVATDTPQGDTVVLPDSADVLVVPDTALTRPAPDSVAADTFYVVPEMEGGARPSFAAGVWVFEREDILGSRALSLVELLASIPGIVPLRGGDFGAPEAVTAFGLGGGGVRVFWDGMEMVPLDGGVTDLGRVGLGGLERIRVERDPSEVRIEITSLRNFDPRAYSLVEAGTGDLDTNFFRGTFVASRALGGSLGLALDRVDTEGPRGEEPGLRSGMWLRYTWHRGPRAAVTAELRRMKSDTEVPLFASSQRRTDWVVRARGRVTDALVAEAYFGRSALEGDSEMAPEPVDDEPPLGVDRERSQAGLHAAWSAGPAWARGAVRWFGGPDLPSTALEVSAGGDLSGVGGGAVSAARESWDGEGAARLGVRAWSAPLWGVSVFGSWETGSRGVRVDPVLVVEADPGEEPPEGEEPEPPVLPDPVARVTDRSTLRLGAGFGWGGGRVSAAWLSVDADSLLPLGGPLDRGALVLPGGERTGFEAEARLPVPLLPDGFSLGGSYQQWDDGGARYLPERLYRASLDFHRTYYETENLELWGALGVEGRDPMTVPLADPDADPGEGEGEEGDPPEPVLLTVPFYQSWYAYVQVRVVTVRIFIRWENFTIRQRNQDFPDRLLPRTRAMYGVRWTLWN